MKWWLENGQIKQGSLARIEPEGTDHTHVERQRETLYGAQAAAYHYRLVSWCA